MFPDSRRGELCSPASVRLNLHVISVSRRNFTDSRRGCPMWLPMGVLAYDTYMFLAATPGWLLLYYSVAFLANFYIMKKPFTQFIRENTPQEEIEN